MSPINDAPSEGAGSPTSKSLQSKLLKQINSLSTKEELLGYIDQCHHLLDTINLATVLYRLARVYSFIQANEQKAVWKAELLESQSFTLLLSVTYSHLTQAQAILCAQREVRGLNARCMSNLLWSIVKLEVTSEPGHVASGMALEVVMTAAPLAMHFLPDCTGQGLGNLLWSFAKVPSSPPLVVTAILARMVELLEGPASANVLDAQALSNSLWSIAFVRSQPNELDNLQEWQDTVTKFLLLSANHCINMLTGANGYQISQPDGQFSYQAMVNIAWSFAAILGSACGVQDPMCTLFLIIRQHAVSKLQAALTNGQPNRLPIHVLTGSFNEQALSHVVYAFDKAQLLSPELLQAVFDVASLRLSRASTGPQGPLGFKSEELCTLIRACHLGIAQPRGFLQSLSQLIAQYPDALSTWTPAEMSDLKAVLELQSQLSSLPRPRTAETRSQMSIPTGRSASTGARPVSTNSPVLPRFVSAPQPRLDSLLQDFGNDSLSDNALYGMPAHTAPFISQGGQSSYAVEGMPQERNRALDYGPLVQVGDNMYVNHMSTGSPATSSAAHTYETSVPQTPRLQQMWIVDASGNLRAVTVLVEPQSVQGSQPVYSVPGNQLQ